MHYVVTELEQLTPVADDNTDDNNESSTSSDAQDSHPNITIAGYMLKRVTKKPLSKLLLLAEANSTLVDISSMIE
jgi:hypothetical protein